VPTKSVPTSPAIARLLRERREALGLTLRAVEKLSGDAGSPIPHSTLARIEGGRLDPGVRRLQQLLRLYHLPAQAAGDLLDLENLAGATPFERDPLKLRDRALTAWKRGEVPEAIASFLAFRERTSNSPADRQTRHEAIVSFSIAASSLGKHQLARHMLDDLLLEKPDRRTLLSVLVQQSVVWRQLGSVDAALAYLDRAAFYTDHSSPKQSGWVHHQRGLILIDAREYAAAERVLKQAERDYTRAKATHDRALVLLSFARLSFEQGAPTKAVRAARTAEAFARRNGFDRLRLFALVELGRAWQLSGKPDESRTTLRAALADSASGSDNVVRFFAHYYLWKAELVGGDPARADVELREASYYMKFVDQTSREARELLELRPRP
jgi:tetratricopeptide (TPR) repeat protein